MSARDYVPVADRFCALCAKPVTTFRLRVIDPERAARVVASVHGVLTAADFYRVPFCEECAEMDDADQVQP